MTRLRSKTLSSGNPMDRWKSLVRLCDEKEPNLEISGGKPTGVSLVNSNDRSSDSN